MTRPYVDQRVVDVAGASLAAEAAADHWAMSAPVLLRRGMNAIYRCDDTVLRVAIPNGPATASLELAETLSDSGIRVAPSVRDDVVEANGFAVTAWQYVAAVDAPTGAARTTWAAVGEMVELVHRVDRARLPADLPVPYASEFPWWDHDTLLAQVSGELDAEAEHGIRAAIERHRGWDDFVESGEVVVCHGDVHPGNVIMGREGPVLIDWDLLCLAPRGWDHAALMPWTERWGGRPGLYADFAEGAGWSAIGDRHADAFAELRLVSATLMRWKVALVDPAARPEAERRLAYWRGDPDAPAWRAQ